MSAKGSSSSILPSSSSKLRFLWTDSIALFSTASLWTNSRVSRNDSCYLKRLDPSSPWSSSMLPTLAALKLSRLGSLDTLSGWSFEVQPPGMIYWVVPFSFIFFSIISVVCEMWGERCDQVTPIHGPHSWHRAARWAGGTLPSSVHPSKP